MSVLIKLKPCKRNNALCTAMSSVRRMRSSNFDIIRRLLEACRNAEETFGTSNKGIGVSSGK